MKDSCPVPGCTRLWVMLTIYLKVSHLKSPVVWHHSSGDQNSCTGLTSPVRCGLGYDPSGSRGAAYFFLVGQNQVCVRGTGVDSNSLSGFQLEAIPSSGSPSSCPSHLPLA